MTTGNAASQHWSTRLLGAPMRFVLAADAECVLEPERHLDAIELIARRTHRRGQRVDAGGDFDWRNRSDVEMLQIAARCSGDATHWRIVADYATMTFFAFFAVLFTGMFVSAAIGGFVFKPSTIEGIALIGAVGFVGSYAAARAVWSGFADKRRGDLQQLLEELVEFTEEGAPGAQLP